MVQTYDNYHKAYYERNREAILERTRDYKRQASARYYLEHKEEVLEKRREKRRIRREYLLSLRNKKKVLDITSS